MSRADKFNNALSDLNRQLDKQQITREEFLTARRELIIRFSGSDHRLSPGINYSKIILMVAALVLLTVVTFGLFS